MKPFTVIALHDETGEVITQVIQAEDQHDAMQQFANHVAAEGSGDLQIVCCVAGAIPESDIVCPCEDAGKACYIADLVGENEDDEDEDNG